MQFSLRRKNNGKEGLASTSDSGLGKLQNHDIQEKATELDGSS